MPTSVAVGRCGAFRKQLACSSANRKATIATIPSVRIEVFPWVGRADAAYVDVSGCFAVCFGIYLKREHERTVSERRSGGGPEAILRSGAARHCFRQTAVIHQDAAKQLAKSS